MSRRIRIRRRQCARGDRSRKKGARASSRTEGPFLVCILLNNLAAYHPGIGPFDAARILVDESCELAYNNELGLHVAVAVQLASSVALHLEACEDAAMLLGHADAAMSATDMVRDPTEQRHYELIMEQLRASRMASSLESYLDEGAALDEADAVALALRRTANRH